MKHAFSHIGIVGAGSWGTALALVLHRNGLRVTVWGNDAGAVSQIEALKENRPYLPGVPLPETIQVKADLRALKSLDLLLLVTPSRAVREVASRLSTLPLKSGCVLLSCTKGVERGSGLRMSEILRETLPSHPIAVLSGPSHAEEVALGAPSAVVLGCEDEELATRLQAAFNQPVFRTYTSSDIIGIELGRTEKHLCPRCWGRRRVAVGRQHESSAGNTLSRGAHATGVRAWWQARDVYGAQWNWRSDGDVLFAAQP